MEDSDLTETDTEAAGSDVEDLLRDHDITILTLLRNPLILLHIVLTCEKFSDLS